MTAVTAPPKASTRAAAVGSLIDVMWAEREKKRKLEAEIKAIDEKLAALEESLTERMDKEGMAKATGRFASVSFTSSISANPQGEEGWTAFYAFMAKKKYWHLLQRRVSDTAYREVLASLNGGGKLEDLTIKNQVPGMLPFTKKRLNLRALATT